jgi:2,4-dienoyl-CoA reductase-like NADH-dependent reductase (Old Yellow Enzyme family)
VETPVIDLFRPYAIGRLECRNRFVRSATTSGHADERGIVGPEIIGRYEDLARGGIGLIIKGHLYVDPRGKAHAGMAGISDDAHIPGLAKVTEVVHRHGGRILAQINHGGYEAETGERMGPSDFQTPAWRARAMDAGEIGQVVQAFGRAARRCLDAGFDGVQIHAAHGYLVSQFLSKHANRRSDEWGGSLTNRMRMLREICLEMRKRLGGEAVIGVKLNCDDFSGDGFTIDESAQVAHELSELGIDLIEVSGGGIGEEPRFRERARSRDPALAEASFGGHCARIRQATVATSLALVDGLRSLAAMQAVIDKGLADLVSLSRPFIREPDLVKKLAAGQREVTCTRCDGCYDILGEEMLRCVLD